MQASVGAFLLCVGGGCVVVVVAKGVRGLAMWSASECCGGDKLICHRHGACLSWVPLRMTVSNGSVMVRVLAMKRAVQPTSHSVPMLMRLCVSPRTM